MINLHLLIYNARFSIKFAILDFKYVFAQVFGSILKNLLRILDVLKLDIEIEKI